MIDWDAVWVDEVRKSGQMVDVIKTTKSVYGIYYYRGCLVQIHKNDGEIAAVWDKEGSLVWLHPRTLAGLERVIETV
jgi:hypothetical protein